MSSHLLNNVDEANLVKRCQSNDARAQRQLYEAYVQAMLVLCVRYIPVAEEAREVLMDGFYDCFKNITSFSWQGEGSFRAWLSRLMVNRCLMHLRKNKLLITDVASDVVEEVEGGVEDALAKLAVKEILAALHTLPHACRAVFNLAVFEQMTHTQIAQLLSISEGTSKSQLHRAKELLRQKLKQH